MPKLTNRRFCVKRDSITKSSAPRLVKTIKCWVFNFISVTKKGKALAAMAANKTNQPNPCPTSGPAILSDGVLTENSNCPEQIPGRKANFRRGGGFVLGGAVTQGAANDRGIAIR
jgi:hypothetical protein